MKRRRRTLIRWSPLIKDHFATSGADLRCYEAVSPDAFVLKSVSADVPQVKAFVWSPTQPLLIGAGLGSGTVVLSTFVLAEGAQRPQARQSSSPEARRYPRRAEFVPKYSRPCNALSWSSVNPHLVAVPERKLSRNTR